ncbi:MAG: hypothetical protein AABX38_00210 [Candidatus Micrarchaeota archaeon]
MSIKDFKNCDIHYAYNQDTKVYSISVMFKGKPAILTMRTGKEITDMTLTDKEGNIIEYLGQSKGKATFTQDKKLAEKFKKS